MTTDRLTRLEDLTRRYARYRPCGAGLGVMWGGVLLAALAALFFAWTWQVYTAQPLSAISLWRFLRTSNLTPPAWLVIAAAVTPFVAWAGMRGIQQWVDGHFGAVESNEPCKALIQGPHWMAPFLVVLIGTLLCGILIWDEAVRSAAVGLIGILAIAAWTAVWGRGSRDRLTQLVMLAVSIPPMYLLASTDAESRMAAGNLVIFGAYLTLMAWLLVKGGRRFFGFLAVRRDLAAIHPADE
jgi:MFS family permease